VWCASHSDSYANPIRIKSAFGSDSGSVPELNQIQIGSGTGSNRIRSAFSTDPVYYPGTICNRLESATVSDLKPVLIRNRIESIKDRICNWIGSVTGSDPVAENPDLAFFFDKKPFFSSNFFGSILSLRHVCILKNIYKKKHFLKLI
jgi:hypothetical protein